MTRAIWNFIVINDCDVIKAYLQQIQLRGKKAFFQSVAERTNDTALYSYMKTTLTRQISLFVTVMWPREAHEFDTRGLKHHNFLK